GDATPCTDGLPELPADHGPVASVQLDSAIVDVIAALEAALPRTEFTPELVGLLRRAYASGAGMADAFGRLLEAVLGPRGLVVYDASDRAAKPLVAELFAREVEHPGQTVQMAAAAGARLEAAGYHAQVARADDSLA